MAKKTSELLKTLRYKNIAVLLAIILLIILILFASCTDSSDEIDPNAQKMQTIQNNTQSSTEAKESSVFEDSTVLELDNSTDLKKGNLVLVNKDHELDTDLTDSMVSLISYNTDSDGNQIFSLTGSSVTTTEAAATQLQSMLSDFYAESGNSTFFISAGYTAKDSQEGLPFDAGYNDASTGLSLSVGVWSDGLSAYDGTGDFEWITNNMAKYGFVTRYPSDKADITGTEGDAATLRYVGLPHAEIMSANGFCLEEYIDYIKSYTFENPLSSTASNGVSYAVYYTEAKKGNTTEVKVPLKSDGGEYTYSVSGNNVDGYIVTVALELASESTSAATEAATTDTAESAEEQTTQAETQETSVFDAGSEEETTEQVTAYVPESE